MAESPDVGSRNQTSTVNTGSVRSHPYPHPQSSLWLTLLSFHLCTLTVNNPDLCVWRFIDLVSSHGCPSASLLDCGPRSPCCVGSHSVLVMDACTMLSERAVCSGPVLRYTWVLGRLPQACPFHTSPPNLHHGLLREAF